MKENEFMEVAVQSKKTPQFNARISEELKQVIDTLGDETGKNKSDLLQELVLVYQTQKPNVAYGDIDLTQYDNLSNPLKESVYTTFRHILNAVNGNISILKQEGIYLEEKKRMIIEKEENFVVEIESIKSSSDSAMLLLKEKQEIVVQEMHSRIEFLRDKLLHLEIQNTELQKEFDNVNRIAEQVQVVMTENRDLRVSSSKAESTYKVKENDLQDKIVLLSKDLTELSQSIFKADLETENKHKEVGALREKLSFEKKERSVECVVLQKELSDIKSVYNKALGKLEILEKINMEQ